MRKFEFVKRVEGIEGKELPKRSTAKSGGYDIFAYEDVEVEPRKINFIKTGIKAKMEDDEILIIANRSSNPSKKGLRLSSGINIIDADYYNNADNEGEIAIIMETTNDTPVRIEKGDKICQCVFVKYFVTEDDKAEGERSGGIGSTGK